MRFAVVLAKARRAPPPGARLADAHIGSFRRAYQAGLDAMASPEQVAALGRAIRDKDLAFIESRLPVYNPRDPESAAAWAHMADRFEGAYQDLLLESGHAEVARLDIPLNFTLDNPYSQAWIDQKAGKLIRDISSQARQNISGLMRASFKDGLTVDQLTPLIQAQISLTPQEASAAQRRYAATLKAGVDPDRAMGMMQTYTDRLTRNRAERIARTETIAGEAAGQRAAWKDAEDQELIGGGAEREWVGSTQENGACRLCAGLDGKRTTLDAPWTVRIGGRVFVIMMPPAHCNCRCTQILVADTLMRRTPRERPEEPPEEEAPAAAEPEPAPPPPEPEPEPAAGDDEEDAWPEPTDADPSTLVVESEPMTGLERYYLRSYQDAGYIQANGNLREGEPGDKLMIESLDAALEKGRLAADVEVYRGAFLQEGDRWADDIRSLRAGDVMQDLGYMSTTTDGRQTEKFARAHIRNTDGSASSVLFSIAAREGQSAVAIGAHTGDEVLRLERELLLPRGTELHVVEVRREGGMLFVKAEARTPEPAGRKR